MSQPTWPSARMGSCGYYGRLYAPRHSLFGGRVTDSAGKVVRGKLLVTEGIFMAQPDRFYRTKQGLGDILPPHIGPVTPFHLVLGVKLQISNILTCQAVSTITIMAQYQSYANYY